MIGELQAESLRLPTHAPVRSANLGTAMITRICLIDPRGADLSDHPSLDSVTSKFMKELLLYESTDLFADS